MALNRWGGTTPWPELRPEAEIWIKRREPWIHEVDGASQHRENRH